jgi:hypothetical protein
MSLASRSSGRDARTTASEDAGATIGDTIDET